MALTKRIFKKAAPPAVVEAPPPVVEPEPEPEIVRAPKNKLPAGKILALCAGCSNEVTIYVDHPEDYDDKSRQRMFKARGSSYKPPRCRWCVGKPDGYWKR